MGGKLIGILGPMFSGKTEEFIRRIKREEIAGRSFLVFKPLRDDRYDKTNVVTNDGVHIPAKAILENGYQIIDELLENWVKTVFIDEIEFFESSIVPIVKTIIFSGRNVVYTGMPSLAENRPFPFKDADSSGRPHIGDLLGLHHDEMLLLHAVCTKCGNDASYTFFLKGEKKEAVVVGGKELFTALCPGCYHNEQSVYDRLMGEIEALPEDLSEKLKQLL